MHPAYSVILFTTASGAGYGLLFWLALSGLANGGGGRPQSVGWLGFGVAFLLITIGLLSSTAHLGRPERAWRGSFEPRRRARARRRQQWPEGA